MKLTFNTLAELDTFLHKRNNIVYVIENVLSNNNNHIEFVTYSLDKTLKYYNTLMSNRKSDSQFVIKTINTETQEQKLYNSNNIHKLLDSPTLATDNKIGWHTKDGINYVYITDDGRKYEFVWLGAYNNKNDHKYKLLWATHNIDLTTEDKQTKLISDYGSYFRWGNVVDITANKGDYYKDYGNALAPSEDAAYMNWGSFCHMPNIYEFQMLGKRNNTPYESENMTVIPKISFNGMTVKSSNGASIFFPYAGYRKHKGTKVYEGGKFGAYWSLMNDSDNTMNAYYLKFNEDTLSPNSSSNCYMGFPIRAVAEIKI